MVSDKECVFDKNWQKEADKMGLFDNNSDDSSEEQKRMPYKRQLRSSDQSTPSTASDKKVIFEE